MSRNDEKEVDGDLGFIPLADFVLLKEIPIGETAGGIVLPDNTDTGPRKAQVLAVGPGRWTDNGILIEPEVQPGDIAYMAFAYSQPQDIELQKQKCLITRGRDLIGKAA